MKDVEWKMDVREVQRGFGHAGVVDHYAAAVDSVGLWESEKVFFGSHIQRQDRILDLGCGTGRTTFGLWRGGYRDVTGADLSPAMLRSGRLYAKKEKIPVRFVRADARKLPFGGKEFDACVFSFNGLMQIPGRKDRVRAMKEIRRVLKPGGVFVFTTSDRDREDGHADYWVQEKERWALGGQDPRLHEFGDLIFRFIGQETFLHIPDRREVLTCLKTAGFRRIDDRLMEELALEPLRVRKFALSCRFWSARRVPVPGLDS